MKWAVGTQRGQRTQSAQVPSLLSPARIETPRSLSLPRPAEVPRQQTGTTFFVDGTGYMLTARHAVEACTRVLVFKEGRVMTARVVALSNEVDLGLIKTAKTLGISAVFPRPGDHRASPPEAMRVIQGRITTTGTSCTQFRARASGWRSPERSIARDIST
jgi:S1-C subfamily serine protease